MSTKIIQPTYLALQPSTGQKIKFRPFTVKEEKALMLALQEGDVELTTMAIKSVIEACTELNPHKIPYYDVEYIYLQIRAKSIGETIDLQGSCDCGRKNIEFGVDIDTVVIDPPVPKDNKMSVVGTEYIIQLQHPSIDDFAKLIETNGNAANDVVANCIQSVMTDDEVLDWSYDETVEFVESMTPAQQKPIAKFLKNMPLVKVPTKYKCPACGKEHVSSMTGFKNFFL